MAAYPKVRVVQGQATVAAVNAGTIIVPPKAGRTITVIDGWMRAIGGAAATATSVDITDTASSPVSAWTMAVGGLTQNAIARMGLATHSTQTNVGTALTADKGLKISKTGGTLATATHIDYCVYYTVTPS
jgi:hypothetical protein